MRILRPVIVGIFEKKSAAAAAITSATKVWTIYYVFENTFTIANSTDLIKNER